MSIVGAVIQEMGGRVAARRGGTVAVDFGDPVAEYAALRQACGLLDPSFRAITQAVGEDRVVFLQGMLSQDVARLAPGEGTDAAILTVQARVVTDLRVYAAAEHLWLDFPAQRRDLAVQTLEKYIVADDVEITDAAVAPLALLEGRQAASLVEGLFGDEVASLRHAAHRSIDWRGEAITVAAVTHSGEAGFLVLGPAALASSLWQAAREAGAVPVGWDALEVARVEAGVPAVDADMDESYLAPEVGLADAVSTRKGCYIGQEVVERVSARGNVQRRLIGLVLDAGEAAPVGSLLRHEGKEVGHVTSSVVSPALGKGIALGYGRRAVWEAGTTLEVVTDAVTIVATVADLPFLAPQVRAR